MRRRPITLIVAALALAEVLAAVRAPATGSRYTILTSVGTAGIPGDRPSGSPEIGPAASHDGRMVAFTSKATTFDPRAASGIDQVYVRDGWTGVTTLVSVDALAQAGDDDSGNTSITPDGRFVVFESLARSLIPGGIKREWNIFVRDLVAQTTELISVPPAGLQGNSDSRLPSISADGRYVAFQSDATNLVAGDANNATDVFLRDRVLKTTMLVSAGSSQQGGLGSYAPSISADGRYVAFHSKGTAFVEGDDGAFADVYVRDMAASSGAFSRISVTSSDGNPSGDSVRPRISADGSTVAFESAADDVLPSVDANGSYDVFVRARTGGPTDLVSVNAVGVSGNVGSGRASISADGTMIAFSSDATDLGGAPDTNGARDVFVRDVAHASTSRVSISTADAQAAGASYNAAISGDGHAIAFASDAPNLVGGDASSLDAVPDTNGVTDIFTRFLSVPCTDGRTPGGPLTGGVHDLVEPRARAAESIVRQVNCSIPGPL